MPTIFVQIASYRDPECQWTVKDLFEKAEHPDRVFVGICWQYKPEEDQDCFIEPSPRPQQTKIVAVRPEECGGVGPARAQAQKFYDGEDYVLMIDSHMRFVPGWDTALIEELSRCDSEKPFISCYPPGYTPPDKLWRDPKPTIMHAKDFDEQGGIRFKAESLRHAPERPLKGAFPAGGFLFAPGKFVQEVPHDPYLYFGDDEICLAARAYTHGWDVFSATKTFVYHYYYEPDKGQQRRLHWRDHKDWGALKRISQARYDYLLCRREPEDCPEALAEIESYGLGTARTLEQFENYCGIDFKTKTVSEKAKRALFIAGIEKYRAAPKAARTEPEKATFVDEAAPYSYDLLPYESHAFAQSHPNNLATIAGFFGMTPAPIDRCRVLELGCAEGGNIIPMAANLEGSEFVGIELSARQIETGREVVDALGLANIKLLHQSIHDVGPDLGTFDYIIAHGVYSWVPEETREKLMSVCKRNLAPDGVAYVSYNTYPGWHMPEALREMMLYHVSSIKDPETQTRQARALLAFLQEATAGKTSAYSLFLREEVEMLKRKKDYYIFHDHLEAVNHPVYFHKFAQQAARNGLQYLGEAQVSAMLVEHFPEKIAAKLRLAGNIIRREQYMDFLWNRRFRSTLLCHEERKVTRAVKAEAVMDCFVTSSARPDPAGQDLASAESVTVKKSSGVQAKISWKQPYKAALQVLWNRWPDALSFGDLVAEVEEARVAAGEAEAVASDAQRNVLRQQVANSLLPLYFNGVVDLRRHRPRLVAKVSERPKVMPLTRVQARRRNWVTNQWHGEVALSGFERTLVQCLDGEHDRQALEAEMARLISAGELIDTVVADKDKAVMKVPEAVESALEGAARRALLVE